MTTRQATAPLRTVIEALTTAPYVTRLGALLAGSRKGRHRQHPGWVVFTYGALARHFRSANRLDAELTTGVWEQLCTAAANAGLDDPGDTPFVYHHYAYWRDLAAKDPHTRDALLDTFTRLAIGQARTVGLLNPNGPGSLTRPHPDRTIYGDGTVVRPIYRGPTGPNDRPTDNRPPTIRSDPSAQIHHRHDGPIRGNNFVTFSVRNGQPSSRIILGIDRVPQPGREAQTAVQLARRIAKIAGPGIQAVVYDGAFKGVHIDTLMRTSGLIVVNRQAAAARDGDTVTPKRHPIGTYTHTTSTHAHTATAYAHRTSNPSHGRRPRLGDLPGRAGGRSQRDGDHFCHLRLVWGNRRRRHVRFGPNTSSRVLRRHRIVAQRRLRQLPGLRTRRRLRRHPRPVLHRPPAPVRG